MSISDLIVVMKDGVLQQWGEPQSVYDDPKNLFVAKFLGTPPINVFDAEVKNGKLCIGSEEIFDVKGVDDMPVTAAIRPEGFVPCENGAFSASLLRVEVMGRDISVVAKNTSCHTASFRAIIGSEEKPVISTDTVRFDILPSKIHLFDKNTENRIYFEV